MSTQPPNIELLLEETLKTPTSAMIFHAVEGDGNDSSFQLPPLDEDFVGLSEGDLRVPVASPENDMADTEYLPPVGDRKTRRKMTNYHGIDETDDDGSFSDGVSRRGKRHADQEALYVPEKKAKSNHEDEDFSHEMTMTPQEEAELRALLAVKQQALDECTKHMKGLSPAQKKRLRNKHASCVSRLKKKLYICNLHRELEKSQKQVLELQMKLVATERERDQYCNGDSGASRVIFETTPVVEPVPTVKTEPSFISIPTTIPSATTSETATSLPQMEQPSSFGFSLDATSHCVCGDDAQAHGIKCTQCSAFFHPVCVGLDLSHQNAPGSWTCPTCT